MPRLSPRFLQTVFYLFRRNPKTGKVEGPCGSGVIVSRESNHAPGDHFYAVTSQHAIQKGVTIIRVNGLDANDRPHGSNAEPHHWIDRDPSEWQWISGGDDIAVLDITDDLEALGISPRETIFTTWAIPETDFVTREFIRDVRLGPGDDGFMLGLFQPQFGGEKNRPAARFGNVSLLADRHSPIEQGHRIYRPSHVFDMHSRPGFSGSPVFVYRTPANALTGIKSNGSWTMDTNKNIFLKLLGIHSGQFPELVTLEKAEMYAEPQPILDGDKVDIPSSMTIVCPASEISRILDMPKLTERRNARDIERRKKRGPRIKAEVIEAVLAPDNPDHKEDFTSLLNAAAKVRSPEDQT